MPTTRFTDKAVQNLKVPQTGRIEYFDAGCPALGLRVSQTGRKSWIFFYRFSGKQRRLTLGDYGDADDPTKLSLASARAAANDVKRRIKQGIDPGDEKAVQRAAERSKINHFENVAAQFIEKYAKRKNRDWEHTEYVLNKDVVPYWRGLDIRKIMRRDVHDVLDRIVERGAPIHANRVLAAVRKLFNWALERDIVDTSPAAGVKKPSEEHSRSRVLTDDELKAIWDAAVKMGYPFGPMYQLLMITGQRLNEVARMQWTHVKGDVWLIPTTKNKEPHEVPLPASAVKVIKAVVGLTGPYVFSGSKGDKPVSGFSRAKHRIDELCGVADWINHDLRRTLSTNMARQGVPPHITEKILNHKTGTISGVAAVYNRYGYGKEKRQAIEAWARGLESIIHGQCSNVVQFERPAAP